MGCRGSKHDVAKNNAVSHRRNRKPASDDTTGTEVKINSEEKPEENFLSDHASTVTAPDEKVQEASNVEEVILNKEENVKDEVSEGAQILMESEPKKVKSVSRDSPDLYNSPRKDSDSAVGGEGSEYDSPRYEPKKKEEVDHELENGEKNIEKETAEGGDTELPATETSVGEEASQEERKDEKEEVLVPKEKEEEAKP